MDPPLLGLVKSPMVVDLDKPFTPLGKGNGSDDGGSVHNLEDSLAGK